MECKYYSVEKIQNKFIAGRTIEGASPLPLFFSNSGIEVNCNGSELWVDVIANAESNEPWIAYEINGGFISRQMVLTGEHSICIYRNMVPGVVKNIRFYRETQPIHGDMTLSLQIKGLRTDGEFLPVKPKDVKLEFIGDSITSGEGTYGALEDMEWLPMYMSSSRQYVNMIAKDLNADVHIVSHGGFGVYSGWDNDRRNNIPAYYEKVCGTAQGKLHEELGANREYDFNSWQPNAIIVNLGTNDGTAFDQPAMEIPEYGVCKLRKEENGDYNREDILSLEGGIINFLHMLRKHSPNAHIVWAYGMLGSVMKPTILEAIDTYKANTGDNNVGFVDLPDTTPQTIGSHGHPGVLDNEKAATVIEAYLQQHIALK